MLYNKSLPNKQSASPDSAARSLNSSKSGFWKSCSGTHRSYMGCGSAAYLLCNTYISPAASDPLVVTLTALCSQHECHPCLPIPDGLAFPPMMYANQTLPCHTELRDHTPYQQPEAMCTIKCLPYLPCRSCVMMVDDRYNAPLRRILISTWA
ncbi:hypothetical protein BU25DRAFT_68334 [Macroventuria anomochaeta]|uniref:Uncharacterized protein n=1 Tax=Macroventuria anomochaeta TaxID=301207 RepID=A0ACB6RYD6_9PLEO|nr:uncharacterized protein BU25DRAFT_68334 [Macroventuria anomochaeta]KAF2627051.1 hypothetical protein BU25DRAFT_68334 [Macroventuria anomochaeta]